MAGEGANQDFRVTKFATFVGAPQAGSWKSLPATRLSVLQGTHLVVSDDSAFKIHKSIDLFHARKHLTAHINLKNCTALFVYASERLRYKFRVRFCSVSETHRGVGVFQPLFSVEHHHIARSRTGSQATNAAPPAASPVPAPAAAAVHASAAAAAAAAATRGRGDPGAVGARKRRRTSTAAGPAQPTASTGVEVRPKPAAKTKPAPGGGTRAQQAAAAAAPPATATAPPPPCPSSWPDDCRAMAEAIAALESATGELACDHPQPGARGLGVLARVLLADARFQAVSQVAEAQLGDLFARLKLP